MKQNLYAYLLIALVMFDAGLTIFSIHYWGAAEANPLMRWFISRSVLLFFAVKVLPIVYLIHLTCKVGKWYYLKFTFWAYLMAYCVGVLSINWKGLA